MKTSFSVTTRIQATAAQVLWFHADPLTASVIDPAVVSYEPEGGVMGMGVRNHIRMKMLGIPVKLTSETIEWEPGTRMGFRSIKPGAPRSVWRHICSSNVRRHVVHVVDGVPSDVCGWPSRSRVERFDLCGAG